MVAKRLNLHASDWFLIILWFSLVDLQGIQLHFMKGQIIFMPLDRGPDLFETSLPALRARHSQGIINLQKFWGHPQQLHLWGVHTSKQPGIQIPSVVASERWLEHLHLMLVSNDRLIEFQKEQHGIQGLLNINVQ